MIIENSQVSLYSKTQFSFVHSESTSIELNYGEKNSTNENNIAVALNLQESYSSMTQNSRAVYAYEDNLSLEDRIKKLLIEILLGKFNGDKTDTHMYPNKKCNVIKNDSLNSTNPYKIQQSNDRELRAIVFNTKDEYYQKQAVEFSSSVKIQTPNQSFEMNLELSFSQEFYKSPRGQ